MNPVPRPDCPKCHTRQNVSRDICATCKWHVLKDRPATAEELEDLDVELDVTIAELEVELEEDITREEDLP